MRNDLHHFWKVEIQNMESIINSKNQKLKDMKVSVEETKGFTPIKIELVIESEQELCDLWLRLNARKKSFEDQKGSLIYEASMTLSEDLFHLLDKAVEQLRLKK